MMAETSFERLVDFATDDRIIRLVAKERGKYAAKNGGTADPFCHDPLYREVRAICPPHKLWSDPGRGKLPAKADRGLARWTGRKKRAAIRVRQAIKKYRKTMPDAPWVQGLEAFILSVREALSDPGLTLETPQILAKFKERDPVGNAYVYRPICRYTDLKTKIILALTYQYILARFDKEFHRNMLFMRAARREETGAYGVPNYLDAIDLMSAYRAKNNASPIYVGECDIQKFYDIFNHDVIVRCFEDLFAAAKTKDGAEDADLDPLRRVIRAYLDSFDYPSCVLAKNEDPKFWKSERHRWRRETDGKEPECRFKWVKDEDFIDSGCYTPEEFRAAREGKKLGIPQGGALSGIIVNVVMRVVDKQIVTPDDPQRLFIRYCDDILLMHTDKQRCAHYLDLYHEQLLACKLVPHARKDVAGFKSGKRTKPGFWHSKSKNVYRWGSGAGNASDWVAFVGYEMRRTGEIRIRKDKIDGEFRRIARKYYDIICSRDVTSGEKLSPEDKQKLIARMDTLPGRILDYEKAKYNVYTRAQARRLDKYLYRKTVQAARKIWRSDAREDAGEEIREAVRGRTTYVSVVVESLKREL